MRVKKFVSTRVSVFDKVNIIIFQLHLKYHFLKNLLCICCLNLKKPVCSIIFANHFMGSTDILSKITHRNMKYTFYVMFEIQVNINYIIINVDN